MAPVSTLGVESSALTNATVSVATVSVPANPLVRPHRFDFGQFVSRQFNFVYVALSAILLLSAPLGASTFVARLGWFLGAVVVDVALVQGFKHLCYIPRPNANSKFCWGRRPHSGFPSGHTLPAFLFATLMAYLHPALGLFWFSGAALIGWGRWRVRAHYAYQVILSALIGIGIGLLFTR